MTLRCGSLFSGAGLLDIGLAQAGIGHEWFIEADPWRREHLARRWPGVPVFDDVRTVGGRELGGVDVIAGGWPCKGNSTAGRRNGLAHPETALWADFARIVRDLRPRFVAVENVANVLAIHGGAVWGTVLGDLAALGYDVAWSCVRASDFGAPHRRDRVVAIARHADGARLEGGGLQGVVADGHDGTSPVADPAREPERTADDEADAEPGVGRARQVLGERGHGPVADPSGSGGQGARPGREGLGGTAADGGDGRTPSATTSDASERGRRENERDVRPGQSDAEGVAVEWGDYEPAIRRWEAVHGPAPAPLESAFRGLDDGDAKLRRMRARVDRSRLSALGDGVQVQLGYLLGRAILELERGGA